MDPNPFKHPAVMLARVRDEIAPALLAAGFKLQGRNNAERPVFLWIDYTDGGRVFHLAWDRRHESVFKGLLAELIEEPDRITTVASEDFAGVEEVRSQGSAKFQQRIEAFAATVNSFLEKLPLSRTKAGL